MTKNFNTANAFKTIESFIAKLEKIRDEANFSDRFDNRDLSDGNFSHCGRGANLAEADLSRFIALTSATVTILDVLRDSLEDFRHWSTEKV